MPWSQWGRYVAYVGRTYSDLRWAERAPRAVFRGSFKAFSTGCIKAAESGMAAGAALLGEGTCNMKGPKQPWPTAKVHAGNWQQYGRSRLLHLRAQRPDLLNVAFHASQYPRYEPWNLTFDQQAYPIDAPAIMSLLEQRAAFRYAVYAEGNCGWADRLKHLFLMGFLVFVQLTPCREFYTQFFDPWVHYIPVDGRFDNLTAGVEWANAHEAEAEAMATASQARAMRVLTPDSMFKYAYALFGELRRTYAVLQADPRAAGSRGGKSGVNALTIHTPAKQVEPYHSAALYDRRCMLSKLPEDQLLMLSAQVFWNDSLGWWQEERAFTTSAAGTRQAIDSDLPF